METNTHTTNTHTWTKYVFSIYTLIGWLLIIITGSVLRCMKKIAVFRDYDDLALVFLMTLAPLPLLYLLIAKDHQQLAAWLVITLEAALFLLIVIRTFKNNSNPLCLSLIFLNLSTHQENLTLSAQVPDGAH